MPTLILPSNLTFLSDLKENNNRDWFQANKKRYKESHENTKNFSSDLLDEMNEHDDIEGIKVFRIYRDVRFSKDKSPYKSNWAMGMTRSTELLRGGYYLSIQPDNQTFIGGGFYNPNSKDLKLIRQKIARDDQPMRAILADKTIQKLYGTIDGDKVKTAPKGFKKDHPAIDLLRHKAFIFGRNIADDVVMSDQFMDEVVKSYLALRPFFDYMSEVLTTDMDGSPLYE